MFNCKCMCMNVFLCVCVHTQTYTCINNNSNANLADKYITMPSFSSGDKVLYVCDVGYTQAGGSRYRRCSEGKWSPLRLKCERKYFFKFFYLPLQFLRAMLISFSFGILFDFALFISDNCFHNRFYLVGRAHRTCMSEGWDGRVPVCEAVDCEAPPQVKNADMIGPMEPSYTYRTVISYQCQVGILVGKKELWCTKDGKWSHPPPTCKEITCPSPNVPRAFWTRAHKKVHQPRDNLSIECNRGYIMSGPKTVTCGIDGRWLPALPKCIRMSGKGGDTHTRTHTHKHTRTHTHKIWCFNSSCVSVTCKVAGRRRLCCL
uniref:Complement receptor type 1-like n=1 Tax=Labrus bergylta TaxID=56723 RepID=A0A3Q3LWN3_9LABR